MFLRICLALPRHTATHVRLVLNELLDHKVEVVGETERAEDVKGLVQSTRADAVILDPAIDDGAMLRNWRSEFGGFPALICVTATAGFAVEAFEAGAVHFMMLPLASEHMAMAMNRAAQRIVRYDRGNGSQAELHEQAVPFRARILALPSAAGIDIRSVDEVIRVNGEGAYTKVTLQSQPPVILSKCLGELERTFTRVGLVRVHRSHMINLMHVRQVRRGKTPVIHLSNGDEVDISPTYRDIVFDMLHLRIGRREDRA